VEHNARTAVVTCTPLAKITGPGGNLIYKPVSPLWHRARMSLSYGTNINNAEFVVDGLEVGDARSRVAARVLKMTPNPYYLLFIDSDVIVPNDAFTKLFYHLKTKPNIDIACGIYVVKGSPPYDPLIYRDNGEGAFWDFAVGDILTTKQHGIRAVHMGLTLIRVSLFQRMIDAGVVHGEGDNQDDEPFFCTQDYSVDNAGGRATFKGTEDIYFCAKARKVDAQILVDTSVLAGHVDENTGMVFGLPGDSSPIERAKWLPLADGSGRRKDRIEVEGNKEKCNECNGSGKVGRRKKRKVCSNCQGLGEISKPLKLAIDLGAGESHRQWEGYKTYRLDARVDSKPDYCQEMENLNLPDNHYDLVASRHSFEHVGRFQQERLWREAFRICKPGGRCEIVLPNAEWAAEKIVAGEMDMHVLNVLLGGAETDVDMKESGLIWNVHKFIYTPEVAKTLAETAGFVNVVVIDYKIASDVGYHMTLNGEKLDKEQIKPKEDPKEESNKNGQLLSPVETKIGMLEDQGVEVCV
jgi:predicted SAM-dependent methyltransferase